MPGVRAAAFGPSLRKARIKDESASSGACAVCSLPELGQPAAPALKMRGCSSLRPPHRTLRLDNRVSVRVCTGQVIPPARSQ